MNPNDSNVEPVGTAGSRRTRSSVMRRQPNVNDCFAAWLKEQTIPITGEYFGSDATQSNRAPILDLNAFRPLASTA